MNDIPVPGKVRYRAVYAAASGDLACGANYAAGNCLAAQTGLTITVNTPLPGYIVTLTAKVSVSGACEIRLHDGAADIDEIASTGMGHLHGIVFDQTPGTPVTYTVDGIDLAPGACVFESGDYDMYLMATVEPAG
jgi:hypothetical protein